MALSGQTNHPIRVLLGVGFRRPIAANDVGVAESEAIQVGLAEKAKEFTASGGEAFLQDVTEMLLKSTLAC